jgi:hypothetical protein
MAKDKKMTRFFTSTAVLVSTVASFGFAQTDSVSCADSSSVKTAVSFQPLQLKQYSLDNYFFSKNYLRPNYADTFFTRPIYYNNFFKRDFTYKFNPTNPWRTSDPFESIINGSTNYLLQVVDKKYFYKK